MSRWEQGLNEPSIVECRKLADFFDINLDVLCEKKRILIKTRLKNNRVFFKWLLLLYLKNFTVVYGELFIVCSRRKLFIEFGCRDNGLYVFCVLQKSFFAMYIDFAENVVKQ